MSSLEVGNSKILNYISQTAGRKHKDVMMMMVLFWDAEGCRY